MRAKRTRQMSINETFSEHDIGQELEAISGWLDQHLDLLDWVEKDIQRKGINLETAVEHLIETTS